MRAHSADLERFMQYPSMEPQPCCALPWCGRAFSGPTKRYHVTDHLTGEKKVVEYPEGIDAHHVMEEKRGPVVYWCHRCHMRHEQVEPNISDYQDGKWVVFDKRRGIFVPQFIYNPYADIIPFDDEDSLGELAGEIREKKRLSDTLDYLLSRDLVDAAKRLGRKDLAEWCVDNLDISPRSVGSYLAKRIAYGSLPEDAATLGITNGYLVAKLAQEHPLDEVLRSFGSMSRPQFLAQYGLSKKKHTHTCPDCGQVHSVKGE